MAIKYIYQKTHTLKKYLNKLEILKKTVDILPNLPHIETNLRRKSLLKSSLYSARIEGNKLQFEDVAYLNPYKKEKNMEKLEIFNILKALEWVYQNKKNNINLQLIVKLHTVVFNGLSPLSGRLRTQHSAIFNTAGVAVYLAPPYEEVPDLLKKLTKWVNCAKETGPVKAAVAHFAFEKIHPFLDGNGRVGRLLSTQILNINGFSFRSLVSLEEFFDNNRQAYYDYLATNDKDITGFVEFFLEGLVTQVEKAVNSIKENPQEKPEDNLLPRRREILEIIRDHQTVTFDYIRRRFVVVPDSTLHYDLKQLHQKGFIKKLGTTKGVLYSHKNSTWEVEM